MKRRGFLASFVATVLGLFKPVKHTAVAERPKLRVFVSTPRTTETPYAELLLEDKQKMAEDKLRRLDFGFWKPKLNRAFGIDYWIVKK